MADLPGAQLLRDRGEPGIGVNLVFGEQAHRLLRRMQLPADVSTRIETHVGYDTRQKHVLGGTFAEHSNPFALEIAECPDACPPEYLEAAELDATEHHDRVPRV